MTIRFLVLLLAVLVACKGPTEATNEGLSGAWLYESPDVVFANGNECHLTYRLHIETRPHGDEFEVFSGFAEDGTFWCGGEPPDSSNLWTSTINNGIYNPEAQRLLFDISTTLHHLGALQDGSVTGTAYHGDTFGWGEGQGTFTITRVR